LLVNKNKTKKDSSKYTKNISDNIQSMRSWVRKIEQSTNSISSRLSAVEKRISVKTNDGSKNTISGLTIIDGPLDNLVSKLKDSMDEKNPEYIFRVLDSELAMILDDIENQESEIGQIKDHIDQLSNSMDKNSDELIKTRDVASKYISDIKNRVEKLERKSPPTMKLGKIEIPIEISGIIAGLIALIAALLISVNKTDLLTSPIFLTTIGITFIGSVLVKAIRLRNPSS